MSEVVVKVLDIHLEMGGGCLGCGTVGGWTRRDINPGM
jgi:Fe-S cluster biogenesis protein NfuA